MQGNRDNRRDSVIRIRFGSGDFIANGPHAGARYSFIRAAAWCVPDAFTELALVEAVEPLPNADYLPHAAFDRWAVKWGFTDDWTADVARQLVRHWRERPGELAFMVGTAHWEIPEAPPWNPVVEREQAYKKRLRAYKAAITKVHGLRKAPTLNSRHFEWLAYHHVDGWTYQDLVNHYTNQDGNDTYAPALRTISCAINETAALIGLTVRPAPGRRKS